MTRKGYEDPYADYNIATPAATPPATTAPGLEEIPEADTQEIVEQAPRLDHIFDSGVALSLGPMVMIPPVDPALQLAEAVCNSESEAALSHELSESEPNTKALTLPLSPQSTQVHDNSSIYMDHASMMADFDLSGSNCSFGLDADPVSLHLASMGNLDLLFNTQSQYQPMQGLSCPRSQLKPRESKANPQLRV